MLRFSASSLGKSTSGGSVEYFLLQQSGDTLPGCHPTQDAEFEIPVHVTAKLLLCRVILSLFNLSVTCGLMG